MTYLKQLQISWDLVFHIQPLKIWLENQTCEKKNSTCFKYKDVQFLITPAISFQLSHSSHFLYATTIIHSQLATTTKWVSKSFFSSRLIHSKCQSLKDRGLNIDCTRERIKEFRLQSTLEKGRECHQCSIYKCRSGWDGILSGLLKSIKSAIIVEYLIHEESYSTVRIQKKERGKTNAYSSITFKSFNSFLNRVSKLDTTTTLTATLLTELGVRSGNSLSKSGG
jgi:hypothetical protein